MVSSGSHWVYWWRRQNCCGRSTRGSRRGGQSSGWNCERSGKWSMSLL